MKLSTTALFLFTATAAVFASWPKTPTSPSTGGTLEYDPTPLAQTLELIKKHNLPSPMIVKDGTVTLEQGFRNLIESAPEGYTTDRAAFIEFNNNQIVYIGTYKLTKSAGKLEVERLSAYDIPSSF